MKKNLVLLFIIFCFCLSVSAQEFDFFDKSAMDAFNNPRKAKPANDQDVEKAFKQLQDKKDKLKHKRHFWEKKPVEFEGKALQDGVGGGILPQPYLLVQISQNLQNEETVIPQGFYTVAFDQSNNTLLLKQGYTIMAYVKMAKTPVEPQTDDLYYIKAKPEKDGVKFLYGEIENHFEGFCRFVK